MTTSPPPPTDPADARTLAARLFDETWSLLDRPDRSTRDEDRMIHAAHASRFHWDDVGSDQQRAVGEWQCSRVYAVLGRAEPALHHARRALVYAAAPGVDPWVAASAQEALARALAVAGEQESARQARDVALTLARAIEDEDDRAVVVADIDTLPLT